MGVRTWTDDQKKVIDTRDNSILVSAAAGSGKTAVLVERIIGLVCDEKDPVDVDRLLVVTFTRAAAKEMKERIYNALHKKLADDPGNPLLARQMTLVHSAHISTIDSFAADVVKSYYYVNGLDGDMHMGDEGELQLLLTETMDEMLESEYEEGSELFLKLVAAYKYRERDTRLCDMIDGLYEISMSYPYPDRYLESLLAQYEITDERELLQTDLFTALTDRAKVIASDYLGEMRGIHEQLSECGHPYEPAFASDISLLEKLASLEDYSSFHRELCDPYFARLASCRGDAFEELKEIAKAKREECKKGINKLKEMFEKSADEILQELAMAKPFVSELVRLTRRYNRMYSEKKKDRRIMDFSDMEHYALDILVDPQTGEPTQIARGYREYFREVMVDEYQDSNMLQEKLLSAISDPCGNYFMVGDVKQSIYAFRQARPDIFTTKYKAYSDEPTGQLRIDLSKNFRSRKEVLDITNRVFSLFMDETIGMVTYDDRAKLYCGADYPEGSDYESELLLVPSDSDVTDDDERSIMLESRSIGGRIKDMVGSFMIRDGDGMRPLRYSDIAILNRSANSNGDMICKELADMDIPCEKTGGTGYFSVMEVEIILAVLSVINNPYDDIAMAAVLRSAIFDFSDEELLLIRMADNEKAFCDNVLGLQRDQIREDVFEKLEGFRGFLSELRKASEYESVDALLYRIYDETGYLSYVTALPGGEKRRRNLEKLLDMAQAYSGTSYRGIYHFVKYIEKLKKYEIDQKDPGGESGTDAVRLMTIHKSKGLEFPVVFICGMGQKFRFDNDTCAVSSKYGLGLDIYDKENSLRIIPFHKSTISYFEKEQVIGEEARVLYVAMTRAKEKLIMTASLKQSEIRDIIDDRRAPETVTYNDKMSSNNYLRMVLPAFLSPEYRSRISAVEPEKLIIEEVIREHNRPVREDLMQQLEGLKADDLTRQLLERDEFVYDTGGSTVWKSKYSVSAIKKQAFEEAAGMEVAKQLFAPEPEFAEHVPRFMGGSGEVNTGAERGTAMHRFLECFDFRIDDMTAAIDSEIERQVSGGFLQEEQRDLLQKGRLKKFLASDLAGRMHRASLEGKLYRERTFVMGDKPRAFFGDIVSEEDAFSEDDPVVLVQGIIDAYFIEDDKVFLIDYKTDRVDTKEELLRRYKKQMLLYRDVLNRTLHLDSGGVYMYSFALESLVEV